ncbi:MAG: hypothetical protein Q8M29_10025 [Bacteroidota bacterium]|nr:hypothetical protein [Bacteroidota bacterium]
MSQHASNLKFGIGIALILIGTLICFNLFLLLVGIPIFLAGVILVLLSKKTLLVKSITIVTPIILWWTGFEVLKYMINKKTAITLLVPDQFKGQIRVVYGEKGGVVPQKVDGRMELKIPESGVLIIQPHLESGLDDINYYYVDGKGIRQKMNELKSPGDNTIKRPSVYFEGTGSSTSLDPEKMPPLDYLYDSFYVLKNDSDKVETQVDEMKNNALTDSLVKVSRQLK